MLLSGFDSIKLVNDGYIINCGNLRTVIILRCVQDWHIFQHIDITVHFSKGHSKTKIENGL